MENKKYWCDELNNTLTFMNSTITSCCSGHLGPTYYGEHTRKDKIDYKKFLQVKENALNNFDSDFIDNCDCKGCFFLRERKEDDNISPVYNFINLSHWAQCNCGCIYCARMLNSKGKITTKPEKSEYYDFLPVLKDLYKNKLLDKKHLTVRVQGGDLGVLKEFKDIVKEFQKQNGQDGVFFQINSSNIEYQPIIKDLLDKNMALVHVSLDCGSREVYKKIKRVDKFDDFINNLKKYVQTKHPEQIIIKYIIVEHINDNKEEITKFVNLMKETGIKNLNMEIDFKYSLWGDLNSKPIPSHYKELYEHFFDLCKQNKINICIPDYTISIVEKYLIPDFNNQVMNYKGTLENVDLKVGV